MNAILALLFLSACIVPTGQFVRTDNPRQGVWVAETGHQWIWHVDQPEVIASQCGGFSSCTRWVIGSRRGELWLVDSVVAAPHECGHALGFSLAMTERDIQAQLQHLNQPAVEDLRGMPAMIEPCGASTWSDGDRPGRLKTVEQRQHEQGKGK